MKLYIFIHNEVWDFDKNSTQPDIQVNRVRDNESQLYLMVSLWKGNLHNNKKYVNNPQTVFQKYSNVIEILQFFDFGQQ